MSKSAVSPDLLTIIVTTSPVPSAPSPDLIKNTLFSLPPSISSVPIIITFDNYTIASNDKGRLKKGSVPQVLVDQYPMYIRNVCDLFDDVSYLSDNTECSVLSNSSRLATFLLLKKRNGFAFSVKTALNYVQTPYVMILQHDWLFAIHPPMSDLLSILQTETEVRYISFIARMSLNYEISRGHSHSYSHHIFSEARNLRKDRLLSNDLIACLHWFDRPHLCSVETYREIFSLPIVKRGDFIEDTFGIEYIKSMMSSPTKETAFDQWQKWGAWLYYPKNGTIVTVLHQHGRKNLLGEREEEKIQNLIKSNREKHA
ncbi:unnamed protein product [Adineta ricciae]|uniref:Uncharacterized protein n=1 Tax=Adineta ricciae TaxID=249248 RepID=A0A815NYK1_ADIRI|nr:unnamed protein product [Adineta ricciae]CAF1441366.1 unnamed protein product [Adineta ricciae]